MLAKSPATMERGSMASGTTAIAISSEGKNEIASMPNEYPKLLTRTMVRSILKNASVVLTKSTMKYVTQVKMTG